MLKLRIVQTVTILILVCLMASCVSPSDTLASTALTAMGQGVSTERDNDPFDINEEYFGFVGVLTGELDGRAITLFLRDGGTSNNGKDAYQFFIDFFSYYKNYAMQKTRSPFSFRLDDCYGEIMPSEHLLGDFKAIGDIITIQDYIKENFADKNIDLTALKTVRDIRLLYEQIVPIEQWYIAPDEKMIAINPMIYVETFVVDGKDKLLFTHRSNFAFGTGRPDEYIVTDLISGERLYGLDDLYGKASLTPKKKTKAKPFAEFFKKVKYDRAYTPEGLKAFYEANIPVEKQYFYQRTP